MEQTSLLEKHMDAAMNEAQLSLPADVPIGAVVVDVSSGEVIAAGHNERESLSDATCHAEVTAIRNACARVGDWRLGNYVLFSTLEPCVMCAGALSQARIGAVVFGAHDQSYGASGSIYNFFADPRLPHNPPLISGVRGIEASEMVSSFFASKR